MTPIVIATAAPNWADIVLAVSTAVLGLGVLIALFQLREAQRDRHIQWIFEMNRVYTSQPIRESFRALWAIGNPSALEDKVRAWKPGADAKVDREMETLQDLPTFLESVAITSRFGRVDLELVWQSLSAPVDYAWKMWEPSVMFYRELDAEAFTEFESLAVRLKKYEAERLTLAGATLDTQPYRVAGVTQRLVSYAVLLLLLTIIQIVVITTK